MPVCTGYGCGPDLMSSQTEGDDVPSAPGYATVPFAPWPKQAAPNHALDPTRTQGHRDRVRCGSHQVQCGSHQVQCGSHHGAVRIASGCAVDRTADPCEPHEGSLSIELRTQGIACRIDADRSPIQNTPQRRPHSIARAPDFTTTRYRPPRSAMQSTLLEAALDPARRGITPAGASVCFVERAFCQADHQLSPTPRGRRIRLSRTLTYPEAAPASFLSDGLSSRRLACPDPPHVTARMRGAAKGNKRGTCRFVANVVLVPKPWAQKEPQEAWE
jgi:hypothetical protein